MQVENDPSQPVTLLSEVSNQKRPHTFTRALILTGFIIIVSSIGVVAYNLIKEAEPTSADNRIQSVFSATELHSYQASDDGFTISMPGTPDKRQSSATMNGVIVPITTYERMIENGAKVYTVTAYNYANLPAAQRPSLEAALTNTLGNTAGAQVVEQSKKKYSGLDSIEATYNIGNQDKLYESHVRFIAKDSKIYAITLVGGDKNKFDEFANSFKIK